MTQVSISDFSTENSDSILVPLDQLENELVKKAIARALSVRGGFVVDTTIPIGTDGMQPRIPLVPSSSEL
jgi:hypothetical protein